MKLLIFGKTGQVARELARATPPGVQAVFLSRSDVDLRDPASCAAAVRNSDAGAVINAAAFTAVDLAETKEAEAIRINSDTPGAIATACAGRGVPFLHLSTDYVFDGAGTMAFAPGQATAPLNAYGRSKCRGEAAVRDSGAHHLILRTSWVFSVHGQNFLKTMLRLGRDYAHLRVVADQVGGPTPAPRPCGGAPHRCQGNVRGPGRRNASLCRHAGCELGGLRPCHHGRCRALLQD